MIHFKPDHHELVSDLGFVQNRSGFYNTQSFTNYQRSEMEIRLQGMGFSKKESDISRNNLVSYIHPDYPNLEIHIRKIDPIVHQSYITSKNHEPSVISPVQRKLEL